VFDGENTAPLGINRWLQFDLYFPLMLSQLCLISLPLKMNTKDTGSRKGLLFCITLGRWRGLAPTSAASHILPFCVSLLEKAMLHDENVYPEPFQFKPERFLTIDGLEMKIWARDPDNVIWGFGRRSVQLYYLLALSKIIPTRLFSTKNLSRLLLCQFVSLDCHCFNHYGFWSKK